LPDGIFSNQKFRFWYILESLGMEIFVYLVRFMSISCIICDHFEYLVFFCYIFPSFGVSHQAKSGNPDQEHGSTFLCDNKFDEFLVIKRNFVFIHLFCCPHFPAPKTACSA
jgi:hypothetical protein